MLAEKVVRSEAEMKELFAKAKAAGYAAVEKTVPVGMKVVEHADPLDDSSPVVRTWDVPQGACGFAWITIHPGGSREARYAKKHLGASPAYGGGMQIWVHEFGQSVDLKDAYASAFAAVLKEAGITAYAGSRLD